MSVLRNRNFATLLFGQLISTFGNNLFGIALPWYVYIRTGSKADLAWTGIAMTLPALFGFVTGVFVDRWNKRATMAASDTLRAILCAVLVGVVMLHQPLWVVLVVVLLLESIGRFFDPAASALLPQIVPMESLASASGLQQSSAATAQLVGTLSGGALLGVLGPAYLFAGDGASFLVSTASVLLIRVREVLPARRRTQTAAQHGVNTGAKRAPGTFAKEWREGFSLLLQSKFLRLLMAVSVCANFSLAPVDIALTAWVKGPLHGDALQLSMLTAFLFVGIIVGGLVLGPVNRRLTLRQVLTIGLLGVGVLLSGIGLLANFFWDASLLAFSGLCLGVINGSTGGLMAQKIPAHLRGRTFATLGALGMLAMPLGMALFGVLVTHVPLALVFVVSGALCAASGVAVMLPIPDDLDALNAAGPDGTPAVGGVNPVEIGAE